MKYLWKLLVVRALLVANDNCSAQPLMETVYDAHKLKENEQMFVGQPLRTLLKEIGPEIKTVFVESNKPHKALSHIIFKFVDRNEQRKYQLAGQRSLSVIVYIKESFDWSKSKAEMLKWTNEDAERYGSLTVIRVDIVGEVYDENLSL